MKRIALMEYLNGIGLPNDLKVLVLVATAAICAGLLVNQIREKPLQLVHQSKSERLEKAVSKFVSPALASSETSTGEIQHVSLDEVRRLSKTDDSLIVDARPEIFHRLGHIPKAIALPRDEFEAYYAKRRSHLEEQKSNLLIVYCQGGACEDSHLVAAALQRLGFKRIAIFDGGWLEWKKNGLSEEAS